MTQPQSGQPTGFERPTAEGAAYVNTGYGTQHDQPAQSHGFAPLGDIVNNLKVDGTRMVQDNIALAKAEVTPIAVKGGIAGGLAVVALYFVLAALGLLFMAGGFAFGRMWQAIIPSFSLLPATGLGFVTMAVVMILLALVMLLVAKLGFIDRIQKPEATVAEFKASIAALGDSLKRGQQTVAVNSADRASLKADKKAIAQIDKQNRRQA
ncbi:phage holin family protein [Propionibacteriaceae bacterium Y1923]|uniref:phage holin family protein n=1 Tax=Aestuariimicrobium sp. Y1814 TaxID=3418742 RepID=UPI003C1DE683